MTGVGSLSLNILVPAMPSRVARFATEPSNVQLTVWLYLTGLAVAQLLFGPLSDRFCRRPVVLIGLACSWRIGRSITRPLDGLAGAMKQLAAGDTAAAIPATSSHDEIGAMARTLELFRDSIIERTKLSAQSEAQRLMIQTALETISDGFVLFGPDDRLVLCNSRFRELYPKIADLTKPGTPFPSILKAVVERGEGKRSLVVQFGGFAMHRRRCFFVWSLAEAKHLAGAFIVPVLQVLYTVLVLNLKVFRVGSGDRGARQAPLVNGRRHRPGQKSESRRVCLRRQYRRRPRNGAAWIAADRGHHQRATCPGRPGTDPFKGPLRAAGHRRKRRRQA